MNEIKNELTEYAETFTSDESSVLRELSSEVNVSAYSVSSFLISFIKC